MVEYGRGRLTGKAALVTGGGSGIGRASCVLFAREGPRVADAVWRHDAAEKTVTLMRTARGEALAMSGDVAIAADVERIVKQAVAQVGRLDVLMANVRQALVADVLVTDQAEWDRVLGAN